MSAASDGTGTVNEDISGGTCDMVLKAGRGFIGSHFNGNNCEAKSFNLPLRLGKLDWVDIACPLAGSVKIGFHVTLVPSWPAALATSDKAITISGWVPEVADAIAGEKLDLLLDAKFVTSSSTFTFAGCPRTPGPSSPNRLGEQCLPSDNGLCVSRSAS